MGIWLDDREEMHAFSRSYPGNCKANLTPMKTDRTRWMWMRRTQLGCLLRGLGAEIQNLRGRLGRQRLRWMQEDWTPSRWGPSPSDGAKTGSGPSWTKKAWHDMIVSSWLGIVVGKGLAWSQGRARVLAPIHLSRGNPSLSRSAQEMWPTSQSKEISIPIESDTCEEFVIRRIFSFLHGPPDYIGQ